MPNFNIIQIIYTLEHGQELANFPVFPHVLESKRNLITFAKDAYYSHISFVAREKWGMGKDGIHLGLPDTMAVRPTFVKLSLCIITPEGKRFKRPLWYEKCEGKIWWHDLNPGKKNPYK